MDPELKALIEQALIDSQWDWQAGAETLWKRLLESDELRDRFAQPILAQACRDLVFQFGRQVRGASWMGELPWYVARKGQVVPPSTGLQQGRRETVQRYITDLLQYPLRQGWPLGEATKLMLEAEAAWFTKRAAVHALRGQWFALIAARLPNDHVMVKEVLQHEELKALQRQARGEA